METTKPSSHKLRRITIVLTVVGAIISLFVYALSIRAKIIVVKMEIGGILTPGTVYVVSISAKDAESVHAMLKGDTRYADPFMVQKHFNDLRLSNSSSWAEALRSYHLVKKQSHALMYIDEKGYGFYKIVRHSTAITYATIDESNAYGNFPIRP
jgi:hypothetical protein